MDEEEKNQIRIEVEQKRKELDVLRSKLTEIDAEKETWFEKKRQVSRKLSELFRTLQDAKGKRDSFTKQVRDSKGKREELNSELKAKLDQMKILQKEKRDATAKFAEEGDPSKIKREIDFLEMKIETEGMPFKIEQQVMKKIAEKKKILAQFKDVSGVFEKVHVLQKEIDQIRRRADETHKKVQTKADESQKFHEDLLGTSKEANDLKSQEEESLKKFVEFKEHWNSQNELVRVKQAEINDLRGKMGEFKQEERTFARKEESKKLEQQERNVEEKIKKGMKITTEDFLIFQANEHRKGKHADDKD
jgi:uncharacterized coiled-coil DUF342 family protein